MKKRFTPMLLAVIMVFSLASATVLAAGIDNTSLTVRAMNLSDSTAFVNTNDLSDIAPNRGLVNTIVTDEMLLSLSLDDYESCYENLLNYVNEHPNCTQAELDTLANRFYVDAYNKHGGKGSVSLNSFYDDLLLSSGAMNTEELALAKKYPSDLAAVYSSALIANNQAKSRYYSGAYLGNQDAFRHAAWNALIICRFYALQKGDFNWCLMRTKLWTDAHENGEVDPYLSASQNAADKSMDLLNNAAGRAAAETTYTNETLALNLVQEFVDKGYCKRLKTDAQMEYDYYKMRNISTWTLRATNTVGKR